MAALGIPDGDCCEDALEAWFSLEHRKEKARLPPMVCRVALVLVNMTILLLRSIFQQERSDRNLEAGAPSLRSSFG